MPRVPFVAAAVAALFILTLGLGAFACGTVDTPPGSPGSDSSTDTTSAPDTSSTSAPNDSSTTLPDEAIQHPTEASDVVIRVVIGGGFVPVEYNVTLLPEFTLYGDGRIIAPGVTTLEYPGKALPSLQTAVISENAIQAMLSVAREDGLFRNGVDYGHPGVADVATTTITINADGTTYTASIYALGFNEGGDLTAEQQEARAVISGLLGKLTDPSLLVDEPLAWEPYDFTALKVFSRAVDPGAETGSTEIQPNHLPWPLADLGTAGTEVPNARGLREVVISGDDLSLVKPLLDQATQITLWKSGDAEYNLYFRPLLPDEAAAL